MENTDVKVKKDEIELSTEFANKFTRSDAFYTKPKTQEGKDFFIFREIGDYIEGFIIARRSNHHINRTNSFVIMATEIFQNGKKEIIEKGRREEFFANRQIQKMMAFNDGIGKHLRIVFVGRMKSNFSAHHQKVYRIFWNKGVATDKWSELIHPKKYQRKTAIV